MSDWTKIIGAWPGDETDEEVEAFLNPPDAHEGMMTRREVLELIVKRHRQYLEATNSASRSEHWGAVGGLSQVLGWPPAPGITVRNAAHELALLENAEREEAQGNE